MTNNRSTIDAADGRVTDPVCGMRIDAASATGSAEYAGQRYYFCSAGCKSTFESEPARYLGAAPSDGAPHG